MSLFAPLAIVTVALFAHRGFARFARRRTLAVVAVGLAASVASAALSLWIFDPVPCVHDEFSYLLAADTFAHGRLSNPTHPLWQYFESVHIIQQPTYASKYPPAQGLLLALGQRLGGRPLVGVWIGMGLLGAALCWMLQGWVPARWALLGALLAMLRLGLTGGLGYWGQSYWGGAAPAIGGALVFGALRRLVRRPRASLAVALGAGLAILANSRPFEGLVVSLPALAWLAVSLFGKRAPSRRVIFAHVMAPLGTVLVATAAWMAYYNFRVTGDPLLLPYAVHAASYDYAPPFVLQAPYPKHSYRNAILGAFHRGSEASVYRRQRTLGGFLASLPSKLAVLPRFYLDMALGLPLVMLPWVIRKASSRFAFLTCVLLLLALTIETWVTPHYAAPGTALLFLLVIEGLRRMAAARSRLLCVLAIAVPAIAVTSAGLLVEHLLKKPPTERGGWERRRAHIQERLERTGEKHLVIVRYGPGHSVHAEWVYNAADIDGSPVVWARELDRDGDRVLQDYFRDRHAWLLLADKKPPRLSPFPEEEPLNQ